MYYIYIYFNIFIIIVFIKYYNSDYKRILIIHIIIKKLKFKVECWLSKILFYRNKRVGESIE